MYHNHPNFRRPVLLYQDPLSSQIYMAQAPHPGPMQMTPMTPMDPMYSQLMLPANLLATPSPYVTHPQFLAAAHAGSPLLPYVSGSSGSASSGMLPRKPLLPKLVLYASPQQLKQQHNSLEHLNFLRTVVLSGLSPSLSLREILDEIDHGPIENAELSPDSTGETQQCVLAFVNTHILYHFHLKYAKNLANLGRLKESLHNSARLRVTAANVGGAGAGSDGNAKTIKTDLEPDVIKVKTLNYVMEFNATRALGVLFQILDLDLVPLMEKAFRARCSRFGAVEDFVITEDEDNQQLEFLVHFTCIDSAIAVYEYYSSRVDSKPEDDRDDLVQLECVDVCFQQDRCDRTPLVHARKPSSALATSLDCASPLPSSRDLLENHSPNNSILRESLRALELQLNFKGLDVGAGEGTRATSQQSADRKPSSLIDPVGLGDTEFASDESGPALPSIEPHDYLPDHGFGLVHSGFALEPYLPGPPRAYLVGYPPTANASFLSIPLHPEALHSGNRTIFLGNLHPKTNVEEIANNVRAGGLVERILHYRSRRVCFVTFVDPAIALKFYLSHQVMHQLIIRDREVTVNWGKTHSGPLPQQIAYAVSSGASRNVYIGLRVQDADTLDLKVPDENQLRNDFSCFGVMEQINLIQKKNCGFMNFLNIADAIRLVECFDTRDVNQISEIVGDDGQFYEKYCHFKISYGKDRCGNPLKFSYVKQGSGKSNSRSHSVSSHISHSSNILPEKIDPIDEESANVFGINTNAGPEHKDSVVSENTFGETTDASLGDSNTNIIPRDHGLREDIGNDVESTNGETNKDEDSDSAEEFDDDDDISIIINPETTNTSFAGTPKKPRRSNVKRVFHSDIALSDLLNASYHLNNDSSYVSYNESFNQGSHRGSDASQSSFHGMQFPPVQYPRSFTGGPQNCPPVPPFPVTYGAPMLPHSGSQVMSDYLAKSQNENYLYAATVMNGDSQHHDAGGVRDTRRPGRRSSRR